MWSYSDLWHIPALGTRFAMLGNVSKTCMENWKRHARKVADNIIERFLTRSILQWCMCVAFMKVKPIVSNVFGE